MKGLLLQLLKLPKNIGSWIVPSSSLYPSGRQKGTFCVLKSSIFNGYCSNCKHLSLKISPILV